MIPDVRLLCVHAHPDDFEFSGAGTFELWRRINPDVQRRVLICTDGGAGHHELNREATAARRWEEQSNSARIGGYEFDLLRDRKGRPFREGRLNVSPDFLPALWQEIRAFEPHYIFCPPIPADPLSGVHVDHLNVAQAVRSVAYLINVPHAFDVEYPPPSRSGDPRSVITPIILNTYDGYLAAESSHDIAINIESVVDLVADMAWCHQSQLREWLPWVDRHSFTASADRDDWRDQFVGRLQHRKRILRIESAGLFEFFQVTAWGRIPDIEELLRDVPGLIREASRIEDLSRRLDRWRQAAGQ